MPERKPAWTRAVITGGAGFLGTHLCRSLLAAGAEVVCVDNFLTSSPVNFTHCGPSRDSRCTKPTWRKDWRLTATST